MNTRRFLSLVFALAVLVVGAFRFPPSAGELRPSDAVLGVFEGRTPCSPVANGFTGFPSQNCEKIKWELTLHQDAESRNPTTWIYRGTRTSRRGHWTIERGAGPDRSWTVYHLNAGGSTRVLSLLRVDENVLLMLDRELNVLVGDASWSYTLNRTDLAPR